MISVGSSDVAGARCERCGGYAQREPGGVRCVICGYTPLYRQILPRDHVLSGRDRANRERQRALDRIWIDPGRMPDHLFDMLERLEGQAGEA